MSAPPRRPGALRGLEKIVPQGADQPTPGAAAPTEIKKPARYDLMCQKRGFADLS